MNETVTASSFSMLLQPTARQPWTVPKYALENSFQPLAQLLHKLSKRYSLSRVGLFLEKLKKYNLEDYIMGKVLSKLDDISSDLKDVKSELKDVKNSLSGKQGFDTARKYTVEIFFNGSSQGTGMLLREQSDENTHQFFVMTAAHVAIDALRKCSIHAKPIWFPTQETRMLVRTTEDEPNVFLPKSYVLNGYNDIGFIRINFPVVDANMASTSVEQVNVESNRPFDIRYFGQAAGVRMKGEPIAVEHGRVRTTCHSKPGCSGTPIFSEDGKLNSLLHGESKHRGKRTHSSSSHDEFSTFVYLDMVAGINSQRDRKVFHKVNNRYSDFFFKMEEVNADEWGAMGDNLSGKAERFCTVVFNDVLPPAKMPTIVKYKLSLAADFLTKVAFDDSAGEILNQRNDGILDAVAWHPPRAESP